MHNKIHYVSNRLAILPPAHWFLPPSCSATTSSCTRGSPQEDLLGGFAAGFTSLFLYFLCHPFVPFLILNGRKHFSKFINILDGLPIVRVLHLIDSCCLVAKKQKSRMASHGTPAPTVVTRVDWSSCYQWLQWSSFWIWRSPDSSVQDLESWDCPNVSKHGLILAKS